MPRLHAPIVTENLLELHTFENIETYLLLEGINYLRVNPRFDYPLHNHAMYEIKLVLRGRQVSKVHQQSFIQEEGSVLLVPPWAPHCSRADGLETETVVVHFEVDDMPLRAALNANISVCFQPDHPFALLVQEPLRRIAAYARQAANTVNRLRVQAAAFELFAAIAESFQDSEDTAATAADREFASVMADYIEQQVKRNIAEHRLRAKQEGIQELAHKLGYSPSSCNRIFQRIYGMSPRQYWSAMQLRETKALLLDHRLTVTEISEQLGYADLGHFSRQFKRWTGVTPRQYRTGITEQSTTLVEDDSSV